MQLHTHTHTQKREKVVRKAHIRSTARVMYRAGDQNSTLAVDDQCPVIIRHISGK